MSQKTTYLEQGTGPPLIFLHGIGVTAVGWRYQLDEFSADYQTIALDLPGYGGSEPLPQVTFPNLARWLHEFLTAQQLEQPILVGNSYGGMIVQEYQALYPGQTRAAVLTGTSPAFGRKEGDWQQKFIRARLAPLDEGKTLADLAPQIVRGLVGSEAIAEGIALAQESMATVSNETFRAAVRCLVEFDRRENLGQIDIPCLLLVGAEDTNAPPAVMEKMAAKIAGASFRCLPRLGHLAHLEDPARFNAELRTFLDKT
jgi:pimeloyl-ACP methyl ester carboxylesterase